MQGRLENQIKAEKRIQVLLEELPKELGEYYINFSSNKEFRTCLSYIEKLKAFLIWYSDSININLKTIEFTNITDIDIANYLKKIEFKETKNGLEYTSFSYRKQLWSILNSFFDFLDKKRYIENNPVRLIERPTKKDKVSHVFLKQKDLDALIKSTTNGVGSDRAKMCQAKWKERDLAILYTFIYTGMRVSALSEIDINRIDFESNILEVTDKEHKINSYTISPKLKNILLEWLDKRAELLNGAECDALFISRKRDRISSNAVRLLINKFSEEALGQKVSPHRLRAAFGNIIFEETHDIKLTSKAMKHEGIQTTMIYMESDEEKINNQVADIMGSLF